MNIRQLSQHSPQTTSIVSTIRQNAEPTKLPALNAAIQAARPGAQDRGRAV
ncbi:methyl-accepting chemotaxis protein, partial [Pseudomonas aeruginosa]